MVQQWRTDVLVNPLEQDKARWFQMALPAEEAATVAELPLALAETLYPEIGRFGPNGFVLARFSQDLHSKREFFLQMDQAFIDRMSMALEDLKEIDELEVGAFPVSGQNLEDNLGIFAEVILEDYLNLDDPSGDYEDMIFSLLALICIDGFCDPDDTCEEVEMIRAKYYRIFHDILLRLELKSRDYITLRRQ